MLNKRIASVLVAGMVMVSMVGCNARLTIGEKEIFSFSDKDVQQENVVQNDKEVKDKEDNKTNKTEEKKEETKSEKEKTTEEKDCYWCGKNAGHSTDEHDKITEEKYCDWCEDYAGHSTDEHVAQCYDCGEYKKAKDMEFNGRSFHCGCVDEESDEELLVCPSCGGSYTESDMIEDTENGIWYCYGCYDEIMNDRMGGDANGDLEDWEY